MSISSISPGAALYQQQVLQNTNKPASSPATATQNSVAISDAARQLAAQEQSTTVAKLNDPNQPSVHLMPEIIVKDGDIDA